MRVDIEYIRWLKAELKAVNDLPFTEIEWHENNKPILHNEAAYDSFSYTGLMNTDYVVYDLYKGTVETTHHDNGGNVVFHEVSVSPYGDSDG